VIATVSLESIAAKSAMLICASLHRAIRGRRHHPHHLLGNPALHQRGTEWRDNNVGDFDRRYRLATILGTLR